MRIPPMPEDPKWIHDPARDGAGCSWCGSFAQVNDECLCVECFEDEDPEGQGTMAEDAFERAVSAWKASR